MNRFLSAAVATLLALHSVAAVAAPACTAASGAALRPLVELYTSEGCDSCPPADRWLAATFRDPGAAAVPLAFHVDYWDRLGWKDRFAAAAYTDRQYRAAEANGAGVVYTPQALLQGRELAWRSSGPAVAAAAARPARASIEMAAERIGATLRVRAVSRIADAGLRAGAVIGIAYADSGLVSEVKAGENRGARLVHDHVVRAFAQGGTAAGPAGTVTFEATLPVPAEGGAAPALVAFVERPREGDVLQTLVLPLTDCPVR